MSTKQGSIWRRWEPHIHTPGTVLSSEYGTASMKDFVATVEACEPKIEAIGITDYLGIERYQEVVDLKQEGKLSDVSLIFPNIEMRLANQTSDGPGVNIHLLFSPEDSDHVAEIKHILGLLKFDHGGHTYTCEPDQLIRLGRKFSDDPSLDETAARRIGTEQFKVNISQLANVYATNDWFRDNCLIAVSGSSNDGTSGLRNETGSFAALRVEIESTAHIILSANPSQTRFWCGDGPASVAELSKNYSGVKPCLHGSDAHALKDIGKPVLDRYCWIKGDPTFETLRLACLEPKNRVFIGQSNPSLQSVRENITTVESSSLPWLLSSAVELNPGLVAIIGARGSGKTALADVIAHASNSPQAIDDTDSFLLRAREFLGGSTATTKWSDSTNLEVGLDCDVDRDVPAKVRYLNQQFVERLCSSTGPSSELLEEIERVVFDSHPVDQRMGATSFQELLNLRVGNLESRKDQIAQTLVDIADRIEVERNKKTQQGSRQKQLEAAKLDLERLKRQRNELLNAGTKAKTNDVEFFTRLSRVIEERQTVLQRLDRQQSAIERLREERNTQANSVHPEHWEALKRAHSDADLSDDEWTAFKIQFFGDTERSLLNARERNTKAISSVRSGTDTSEPTLEMNVDALNELALDKLQNKTKELAQTLGIVDANAKKLEKVNVSIANGHATVVKLNELVEESIAATSNLSSLYEARSSSYKAFFEQLIEVSSEFKALYEPLKALLEDSEGIVAKLKLQVIRTVDTKAWAEAGEELLDLRVGSKFRRGVLMELATQSLEQAWTNGSSDEVTAALQDFRSRHEDDLRIQARVNRDDRAAYQGWVLNVGRWLYSTGHISIDYNFTYDGTPLARLSPGMRGIVMLVLYLALDRNDERPLIIDQPEENLDPRSVFRELVPLFKDARLRRQILIVTHNANLVVNTDVDQVIVASSKATTSGPPVFTYKAGGLEDLNIRADVIETLEGGAPAFKERAMRLRIQLPR